MMQKKDYISLIHKKEKVRDGKSSGFLNLQEQKYLKRELEKEHITYQVYAYFGNEERVIFSKHRPRIALFQIETNETLTHQMILGSFYGMQIDDKILGDILSYHGAYYIYMDASYQDYFKENFRKVGKYNVTLKQCHLHDLDGYEKRFESISISVSSMRLDAVVSRITGYSREKVKSLFQENAIVYLDEICYTGKAALKEGDTFSIRKFGKYRVCKKGPTTKKGNFYLELSKYLF